MDPLPTPAHVEPNPRIPKTLGILNIVFASALMICGLCSIAYVAMIPVWGKTMENLQKEVQAKEDNERKTALEALAEAEKEATTVEEKAEFQAKRKQVEDRPRMSDTLKMDMNVMGLSDRRFLIYTWTEFVSNVVLNLLLLVAGIGLVMRRMWGLKLGMWVAALKLVRLFLVYGYCIAVIVPLLSQGMVKFQMQAMAQQGQQMGRPMPPNFAADMTKITSVWFAACAVGMILIGSIYPVMSLWLLSRPGARAACTTGSGKAPEKEDSW